VTQVANASKSIYYHGVSISMGYAGEYGMSSGKQTLDPSRWVDEHGDVLFRYALSRLRDRNLAEDIVQEALVSALGSVGSYRGSSSERTWLVGVLKHKVFDHLRKADRERSSDTLDEQWQDDDFDDRGRWKVQPAKWLVDPHEALRQEDFRIVIERCLEEAPARLARVFVLREVDELGSDEICKLLGISATNLWVMLHRARLRLRQCLDQSWFGGGDDSGGPGAGGT